MMSDAFGKARMKIKHPFFFFILLFFGITQFALVLLCLSRTLLPLPEYNIGLYALAAVGTIGLLKRATED